MTIIQPRAIQATVMVDRATGATVVTQRTAPAVSVTTIGRRGPQGLRGLMGPAGDGTFTLLADRPLGGHRLIVAAGAGGLDYADCHAMDALHLLGMTLHAVAAGDEVAVRRFGEITESSWSWTPGLPVYLGRAGVPTQMLPAEAVISLVVGIPTGPTTLFMAPREPIRLV